MNEEISWKCGEGFPSLRLIIGGIPKNFPVCSLIELLEKNEKQKNNFKHCWGLGGEIRERFL